MESFRRFLVVLRTLAQYNLGALVARAPLCNHTTTFLPYDPQRYNCFFCIQNPDENTTHMHYNCSLDQTHHNGGPCADTLDLKCKTKWRPKREILYKQVKGRKEKWTRCAPRNRPCQGRRVQPAQDGRHDAAALRPSAIAPM